MKIFLTLLALVWYLEATMLDISGRPYFCVFKGLTPGILHISVEFVGEKQKSGKIQVFEKK